MTNFGRTDQILKQIADGKPSKDSNGLIRLNLRVPEVRKAVKAHFYYDSEKTVEQNKFWNNTWKTSRYFESMSASLYFYQYRQLLKNEVATVLQWVERCQCWEHSDDLSKIYAQVLEENPLWIFSTLKKWNRSKNPWKRRQSIVSLLEYSCKRRVVLPFKTLIPFLRELLDDDEYYVQKGLGWTMREIYNVYPDEMILFFEKNLMKISPTAYSAATEKLEKGYKKDLNLRRKIKRKKIK